MTLLIRWILAIMAGIFLQVQGFSQGLFETALSGRPDQPAGEILSISGFIRSSVYVGENQLNEPYLQSAYGQASLTLEARVSKFASAFSEIRFRSGSEFGRPVHQIEIRELYTDFNHGPASIRMGKRINTWGKGTLFNPTGKVTPLDPTVRSPEEDDIYLGIWGIDGRLMLGNSMKLTALWNPIYRPGILLIEPIVLPDYVLFGEPVTPGTTFDQGSYGIRYDLYTSLLDASLYWYEGYHHWPGIGLTDFRMDSVTMEPLLLELREMPYRIRMAGLDLSIPFKSWIFRFEGAWQQSRDNSGSGEIIPLPEISYTAELEYNFSKLVLLAGYYGKYILDYSEPFAKPALAVDQEQFLQLMKQSPEPALLNPEDLIRQQLGSFNRLYNYQLEEVYHSVFLLGRLQLFHNQLEFRLPAVWNLTTGEWNLFPGITFSPADGIKLSGGFNGFYGPPESLYNLVGPPLNAGYLSLKITF